MTEEIEIKNCPFCNGKAQLFNFEQEDISHNLVQLFSIECRECECRTPSLYTEQQIISVWNARVSDKKCNHIFRAWTEAGLDHSYPVCIKCFYRP